MAEKLQFVLYYYKTYPTFDVLGTQFAMARSRAHENLHKLSPILYDTLVQFLGADAVSRVGNAGGVESSVARGGAPPH